MTDYAKLINDMRQLTGIFLTFDVDMALPEGMCSPDDAADAIEALIRERDEARAKAIEEAAAICRAQTEGIDIEEGDWHAGWTQCAEACADEILARIHGYE